MDLLKKANLFYKLATIKLAQVIDKTKPHPSKMDEYGDRIVLTNRDKFDLSPKTYTQSLGLQNNKPVGVWYAFGAAWIQHMNISEGKAFRIRADDSKILKITPHNLDSFLEKYSTEIDGEDVARMSGVDVDNLPDFQRNALEFFFKPMPIVDWPQVASDYAGAEIINFSQIPMETRHSWKFLSTWDIDSGCIWDTSIIKGAVDLGDLPSFEDDDLETGYWLDSPEGFKYLLKDKSGLFKGSSLEDWQRKWLSTALIMFNIHLTHDQIKDVEFLMQPSSLTLVKVPAAPSHEGQVIKF